MNLTVFRPGVLTILTFATLTACADSIWLDQLDVSKTEQDWGQAHKNQSVDGHPLTVGKTVFEHGVGTHASSTMFIKLNGAAKFTGSVGLDSEEIDHNEAGIEFFIVGQNKVLWQSGPMKPGDEAKPFSVDLKGIRVMSLKVGATGDSINYDHADWVDAKFEFAEKAPETVSTPPEPAVILTPAAPAQPRINGTAVFGARPNHPFFYHVPVTGAAPIKLSAENLPAGLALDGATGAITGTVAQAGEYDVTLMASGPKGKAAKALKIVIGDKIALTPPMGWNSWNCFAGAVDDAKIRSAADAMVNSGLIQHGWTYINIDDCWEDKLRDANGFIQSNDRFPDMKALADYVHSKGLKIGIYSSPGPKTCAGFEASWKHEEQDAQQYAAWGFDYLKYDWCSYSEVQDKSAPDRERLEKPYLVMDAALRKQDRDIIFSLCQYGMGDVWEGGADVGGNCWRTTGDIVDSWSSMSGIGFNQNGHEKWAGPGHWNDPDMMVVGKVGWGQLHPTRLTANEQYTHVSLWCMLSAPLLIGADMSQLDPFTFSLLSNDEVLAVDQDALGQQASRKAKVGELEVWSKDLADGSKVAGLFNRGEGAAEVTAQWSALGLTGKHVIRDLWQQRDLGKFSDAFTTTVPRHGVCLVKISK